MAERNLGVLPRRTFSRRHFLPVAAGGLALVAGIAGCDGDKQEKPKGIDVRAVELKADPTVVARIKDFEQNAGDLLSVEKAREFMPLIADLYVSATRSDLTREQVVKNTIVYSDDGEDLRIGSRTASVAELMATPVVKQIQAAYPDLVITESLARNIIRGTQGTFSSAGAPGFVSPEGKLFLNMAQVNNDDPGSFFTALDEKVNCNSGTLVQHFRSVALHEMVHLAAKLKQGSAVQPSQEFAQAISMLDDKDGKVENPKSQGGFAMSATFKGREIGITSGVATFEEYAAVYLSTRIAVDNGLSYSIGGLEPGDVTNFEKLLSVSSLDTVKFLKLHLSGDLESLVTAFIDAAKPPKDVEDKKAADRKIIQDFIRNLVDRYPPTFDSLNVYYPNLFGKFRYEYGLTRRQNTLDGCLTTPPPPRPSLPTK